MSKIYHVSQSTGKNYYPGTEAQPFAKINQAAKVAMPGDTVIVHAGEYREWVDPLEGGTGELSRITYKAAEGEKVVIKGSERITSWENVEGSVWKVTLPNSYFGDYNPYKETLNGDWFIFPDQFAPAYEENGELKNFQLHPGEVYLNGKSFYEAGRLEDVKHPVKRLTGVNPPWTKNPEPLLHPEDSVYQWCCEVDEVAEETTIYANFQGADPNKELAEINVRRSCFYPRRTGRNYITVQGFEMCQAATPWTPPTADQPALLGVNWSKGWIIENCDIHDSKCSGISIGKEESTGHNLCTVTQRKPGYQYQMEAVFKALRIGWSKDTIGSHIIRNNVIHDCGQNGIVGHMGCVFSTIEHNLIYNIAVKHEYFGYEIAGIKLHAAIDVQILHNNIHNSALGTWLDWQAQNVRVSGNVYYANDRDLMIEVTHGPYKVDNNIFASDYNFDNVAQGGAYIHNLCAGTMRREACLDRSTPYHFPHSTDVLSTTLVFSGDDRLYQNIYVGGAPAFTEQSKEGTAHYDEHPSSWEEYERRIRAAGNEDHEKFKLVPQPVYINGNAYLNGAPAYAKEENNFKTAANPNLKITEKADGTYLDIEVEEGLFAVPTEVITTEKLGTPRISESPFDDPDGRSITFDTDITGAKREGQMVPGPIQGLKAGKNHIRVWA